MDSQDQNVPVWPERKIYRSPNKVTIASNFHFEYEGKKYSHALLSKHSQGQASKPFTDKEVWNMIAIFDTETKRTFSNLDFDKPIYDNKRLIQHPNTALIDEG